MLVLAEFTTSRNVGLQADFYMAIKQRYFMEANFEI